MTPALAVLFVTLAAPVSLPANHRAQIVPGQAGPEAGTVRGALVSASTGTPVAGARIELVELNRSATSAADGRFEFTSVAPGHYTLTVSTIGYIFVKRPVDVTSGASLDLVVPLAEGTGTYQETVNVSAEAAPPRDLGVSSQAIVGSASLQSLRGIATDDPVRALQALPGAATGDDFQAQFSVRGAAFRHLGFIVDGVATPLLFHSVQGSSDTGSIAMLNTDVLSRGSLATGPRAERDGDWLGATLSFDMREGSRDRTAMRLAVSGTASSIVLEGPLGPSHRGSWLVSARRSYLDWLIRKVASDVSSTFGFTDLHGNLVYDLGSRQQVQLLIVAGDATFHGSPTVGSINGLSRAKSDSGLGVAGWRYASPSFIAQERVSVAGNAFHDDGTSSQELSRGSSRAIVWRNDLTWLLNHAWTVEAGTKADWERSDQTRRVFTLTGGQLRVRFSQVQADRTTLWSGWGQVARRTTTAGIAAGARITTNSLTAAHAVSPWLLGERTLGAFTLRAGAGATAQFPEIQLYLSNARPTMPTERATSIDASVEHRWTSTLRWQVTGFYRRDSNVVRRVGEDRLVNGVRVPATTFPMYGAELDGPAKGVDVVVERRAAKGPSGWIGYTFARTRYRDTITGEEFDGDFDQRHTVNAFVEQRLSYRLAVSAKLRVGSSFPIVGYFQGEPESLQLSSLRNEVRLPTYARIDLRANRTFTFDRGRLTLFVEVMNVLNRRNLRQSDGTIRSATIIDGFVEREIPFVASAGILIEF
jgi:hypothetical protein